MAQPTRALLVQRDPADARLVRELLAGEESRFDVVHASRVAEALNALGHHRFGVVLLELDLPDARGLDALDAVKVLAGDTPVLVWTGELDDDLELAARDRGVRDVLRKDETEPEALLAAVRAVVGTASFGEAVKDGLRRVRARGTELAVVEIDVERWEQLVSGLDEQEEEQLVHAVCERLSGRLRMEDGLFVLGEGRFGVVAESRRGREGAKTLADALATSFERPVGEHRLHARVGHVVAPREVATADAAVTQARLNARRAQPVDLVVDPQLGGPPTPPANPDRHPAFARRLRNAIAADQLVLHYQPVVRLGDDHIPVVEALVRWDDPERGLLPPAEFIPLAEEAGVIEEIGAWALIEAANQVRQWDEQGLPPVRCAVNLSARELCSESLPARVADALAASGLSADRLEVELTESMFADPEATARMLKRLRALGVRVAIDDFGTGYSSLAYLTRFAVDAIKVDGAFVRRATNDADAAEVVRAIVGIAHQLDLEVVAEGVETLEQLQFVREQGADLVQGWLFCEALPPEQLAEWLTWAEERVVERDGPRPVPGHEPKWKKERLSGRERAVRGVTLLAGAGAGVLLGAPFTDVDPSRCPATVADGMNQCLLQKGYAPAATVFMACVLLALVLVDAARRAPAFVAKWRDPQYRLTRRRTPPSPEAHDDPILLAASWGGGEK